MILRVIIPECSSCWIDREPAAGDGRTTTARCLRLNSRWYEPLRQRSRGDTNRRRECSALPGRPALAAAALPLACAAFARHLASGAARFAQADGDRLFAARHLLAGSAGAQLPTLALMHGALHLALRLLAVFGHGTLRAGRVQGTCPGESLRLFS